MSLQSAIRSPRPLASRAKRRLTVLAVVIGWCLMVIGAVLQSSPDASPLPGLTLAGFGLGITFVAYILLMIPWKLGLPSLRDSSSDERQRQQLLQVYTLAYRVIGVMVLLGMMYLLTASGGTLPLPHTHAGWYPVAWAAIILIGGLPTAILAWTEPDIRE